MSFLRSVGRARPVRLLWRVARPILLLAAFVTPVYLFVADRTPSPPARLSASQVLSDELARVHFPDYRRFLPVLTYHDISTQHGRYTVSPTSFRGQMAALVSTGFHTITVDQLVAFLERGAPLPSRPVLLTFDDGLGSAWRAADPVLQAYGLHGVAFVISGLLAHHGFYYLHPGELRQMIRSGRWDVEAHTHLGHALVKIDAAGHTGPFLTNRSWLPGVRRLETVDEFRARVGRDLDLNLKELHSYGAYPEMFAFPFSPVDAPSNDMRLADILQSIVESRFPISFVDADGGRYLDRWDATRPQELPRFEVYSSTQPRDLVRRLLMAEPLSPSVGEALAQPRDWSFEGLAASEGRKALGTAELELAPPTRRWQAAYYSLARSDAWQRYSVRLVVSGLGREHRSPDVRRTASATTSTLEDGTSASILFGNALAPTAVATASLPHYAVAVSAGRVSFSERTSARGRPRQLAAARISPRSRHTVSLVLTGSRIRVSVDGRLRLSAAIAASSHGGIGLGVWRSSPASQPVRFSALRITPR